MKEPIRELRCHYLVTCVYNNSCFSITNITNILLSLTTRCTSIIATSTDTAVAVATV